MPSKTRPYREILLESLEDSETAAAYLTAAMSDSPEMFRKALRNVAQSRQMSKVAREAGVTRESLYRATSEIGNPTLDTLESVLTALGIDIKFEASAVEASAGSAGGNEAIAPSEPMLANRTIHNRVVLTESYYPDTGIRLFGEPLFGLKPPGFLNIASLASTRPVFVFSAQQSGMGTPACPRAQPVGYVNNYHPLNFQEEPRVASAPQFARA